MYKSIHLNVYVCTRFRSPMNPMFPGLWKPNAENGRKTDFENTRRISGITHTIERRIHEGLESYRRLFCSNKRDDIPAPWNTYYILVHPWTNNSSSIINGEPITTRNYRTTTHSIKAITPEEDSKGLFIRQATMTTTDAVKIRKKQQHEHDRLRKLTRPYPYVYWWKVPYTKALYAPVIAVPVVASNCQ